ncbi:N-acetylmuramoyl-L-alanine amidase LytC precursor [uncultured Clostridium sp.]|nr:N-acetylmuramoyl-L-alanine amidase LytC precursor [uncultured Clostridium sp.]SCI86391.1 N-acetylmuramoyl-L-alanine amidase LytC precursor [uncultured Clostridium sp.]
MSIKLNKFTKGIVAFGIISATTAVGSIVPVSANGNLESELKTVMNKYKSENIVVEDGVSLRKGESLDLSAHPKWEKSNENTVEISENGIVTPINPGTVFLSQKIGDKVHIIEVHVARNRVRTYSFAAMPKVNRDHYKVFVDPGHGGQDSGAVGNGHYEDELNLAIAKKVEQKLIAKGIEVKMSRNSDEFISLGDRANMANQYAPDVFVSIHQNSAGTTSANGIETYYHTNKGDHRPYAQDIQTNAINETGVRSRGIKSANFAVLRETNMPAALFESGFITNPSESANLADPSYQDKLANGIANGIEKYLKENIKLDIETPEKPEQPETPEQPVVKNTGVVTATNLNVRSGYGANYTKIGMLKNGDRVEIVESQNGWHKIKYNGGYGYVSGDYIKVDGTVAPPVKPEQPPVKNTGVVTATSLNVRSGYGANYSRIGSLSNGAKVEIVESQNGWHKIKYNGGYGYVSGDYIRVNGAVAPPSNSEQNKPSVKDTGIVTATRLNVRSGYGTNHSVIGSLSNGATVEIVESQNGWYKIKYNGGYGYISAQYVKAVGSINNKPSSTSKSGTVTATSLNVRSGYGANNSKIGSLRNGAKVEIVESKNGWHKIKYNGGYGYVSGEYIKIG